MIKPEFKILRKEGWELNPDDDIVNNIIAELAANFGHCPNHSNDSTGHNICPCSAYLQNDKCYCGLYIKK